MNQNIVPLLTVTIVLLINIVSAGWQNEYDKDLRAKCGKGAVVKKIKSEYKWSYGDRRSEITCGKLPGVTVDEQYCQYYNSRTGKYAPSIITTVDQYWKDWKFSCPSGILVGITSIHKSWHAILPVDDRVFAFRCCKADVAKDNKSCKWTDWQNNYHGLLDYTAPDKHFIKGVQSVFGRDKKYDRRFKFEICSIE